MSLAWVDGRWVDADSRFAAQQRAFGVFETLAAVDGGLPLWRHHLARLRASAQRLGIPGEVPPLLHDAARALLRRNDHQQHILRITLTVGDDRRPSWSLTTRERLVQPRVCLTTVRADPDGLDPTTSVKCTVRNHLERAWQHAKAVGADDALLVDLAGSVLEATRWNVFGAIGGTLWTPPLDGRILPGVARRLLIAAMAARGECVREQTLPATELAAADAVFVTNAVHGPRPAVLAGAAARAPAHPTIDLAGLWSEILASAAQAPD